MDHLVQETTKSTVECYVISLRI